MLNDTILLVDISNSRTKFRLYVNGIIGGELRVLPTCQITEHSIKSCVNGWLFSSVIVSSVVPNAAGGLRCAFPSLPVKFVSVNESLSVDFSGYEGQDTLGADRIANILGAAHYGRFPIIAVDLGTAITFDVITCEEKKKPLYRGGVIAPGRALFRDYLSTKTALLPAVDSSLDASPLPIGLNTQQAIQSAGWYGFRVMIREIITEITSSLSCEPCVIATGGDAEWAAAYVPEIHEVDQLLTFRGMVSFLQSES